nr:MAG TPA: hypothetical protein [Caudoviricetes sp.]
MRPPIEYAEYVADTYINIDGCKREVTTRIFNKDEIYRAEGIVKSLEGMTIDSAQRLLEKISIYLLKDEIR